MALRTAGREAIARGIETFTPFRHGNVSGTTYLITAGRLPAWIALDLARAEREGDLLYVIYSYATPIAWALRAPDGSAPEWAVPGVRYTVTTSGHQSAVFGILARLGAKTCA